MAPASNSEVGLNSGSRFARSLGLVAFVVALMIIILLGADYWSPTPHGASVGSPSYVKHGDVKVANDGCVYTPNHNEAVNGKSDKDCPFCATREACPVVLQPSSCPTPADLPQPSPCAACPLIPSPLPATTCPSAEKMTATIQTDISASTHWDSFELGRWIGTSWRP